MQIHRRTAHSTAMRQIYIPIHSNSMSYHRIALPLSPFPLCTYYRTLPERMYKKKQTLFFFSFLFFIVGAVFTGTGFNLFPLV